MSFDILAPVYRWLELTLAGGSLQRCRCAFLPVLPPPARALLLGEGHGRFLVALLRKFPETHITVVDASAGMIRQAQKAAARHRVPLHRVTFVQADVMTSWEPPPQRYDLIVTHFFLDCFRPAQLDALVPRIARAAAPGATWLLADFQEPPHGWQRLRSQVILGLLYPFFRLFTRLPATRLTCPDPLLRDGGFHLLAEHVFEWGLLRTTRWELQVAS